MRAHLRRHADARNWQRLASWTLYCSSPGALTPDERAIMQRHTQIGAHILEGSESSLQQAGALIAISHHERFDGGGYP
jgi:response regulator RpfG family c-di-GMP phosphodiesterase